MVINLILFLLFLFILIKCASYAVKYSSQLARKLKIPEFAVGFFIVAVIASLPEATIAIISAIQGNPQLGLGTLLGAKITDLTLIFGLVALFSFGGIKVESKILNRNFYFLFLLIFPLILGLDGKFSRIDGIILVTVGLIFFLKIYFDSKKFNKKFENEKRKPFVKSLLLLILSVGILLISSTLTVKFALNFAQDIKIPAILIGLTIISLGTCLPELIFSIKVVRSNNDELAIGDLLGSVILGSTIILGIVALISPFTYNPYNLYTMGTTLFLAGIAVMVFMKTGRSINKIEGLILILIYILYILIGFLINAGTKFI
jgi:cation:H+ antiporter